MLTTPLNALVPYNTESAPRTISIVSNGPIGGPKGCPFLSADEYACRVASVDQRQHPPVQRNYSYPRMLTLKSKTLLCTSSTPGMAARSLGTCACIAAFSIVYLGTTATDAGASNSRSGR